MRITVLDSLPRTLATDAVDEALTGHEVRHHYLREETYAPCQGCFDCWTSHPGTCKAKDGSNAMMRDLMASERLLFVCHVRFGTYDPLAKVALDKGLAVLLPFFRKLGGAGHHETHHEGRYASYPRRAVLAFVPPEMSADERMTFELLVRRNSLNLFGGRGHVAFVDEDAEPADVRAAVYELQSGFAQDEAEDEGPRADDHPTELPPFEASGEPIPPAEGARHALLLVGSAKPAGTSGSENLVQALEQRLDARGWTTERLHLHRLVKLGHGVAPRTNPKLIEAVRRAQLVVLAAPVYVDSLPSLVVAALHQLADADLGPTPPALLGVVQCGFPEFEHNILALDALHRAARAAGMPWAGHLAMGGGGALQNADLTGKSPFGRKQAEALDAAATELDAGMPISRETSLHFALPSMPPELYRFMGTTGWYFRALRGGALFKIRDRPLTPSDETN